MGSDLYMNPPQKLYETHNIDTKEEVMEWVVGAMAMGCEITVSRYDPPAHDGEGYWIVRIFKGQWR